MLNLACVRLLEIVGEAAARVTEPTRSTITSIPWTQIVALRNRLIHGYDFVDFDSMWKILTEDLPPLIDVLDQIVEALPPTEAQ